MPINQSYYDTYANLITLISNICEAHKNVGSVNVGEVDDYTVTGRDVYPLCFVELPITAQFGNNSINWGMSLTIVDQVKHDRTDEQEKINGCFNISQDIIEALKDLPTAGFTAYTNSNSYWVEQNSVNIMTLTRFKDDFTSGIRAEFTLGQIIPVNTCDLSNSFNL